MYKLASPSSDGQSYGVIESTSGKFIPFDENNFDYKVYLKWLEKGNTPEPADDPQ